MLSSAPRRTRCAVTLLALASLGLAACGESGTDKFRSDVDAICKELDKNTNNLNNANDLPSIGREGRKAVPAITSAENKLKKLKVTDDVKKKYGDRYTAFVANFLQLTETFGRLIVTAEQGNQGEAQKLVQRAEQLSNKGKQQSKELGFKECFND